MYLAFLNSILLTTIFLIINKNKLKRILDDIINNNYFTLLDKNKLKDKFYWYVLFKLSEINQIY